MEPIEIIKPVIAMGALTFAMTIWMFASRLPAMSRLNIEPQQGQDPSNLKSLLPSKVTQVAANHNNLFEQPTLFYALALAIAVLGHTDAIHVYSAWAYVAFRMLHSIVHATIDHVPTRFTLFIGATLSLGLMLVREIINVFI